MAARGRAFHRERAISWMPTGRPITVEYETILASRCLCFRPLCLFFVLMGSVKEVFRLMEPVNRIVGGGFLLVSLCAVVEFDGFIIITSE